jgi:hypothetical protein
MRTLSFFPPPPLPLLLLLLSLSQNSLSVRPLSHSLIRRRMLLTFTTYAKLLGNGKVFKLFKLLTAFCFSISLSLSSFFFHLHFSLSLSLSSFFFHFLLLSLALFSLFFVIFRHPYFSFFFFLPSPPFSNFCHFDVEIVDFVPSHLPNILNTHWPQIFVIVCDKYVEKVPIFHLFSTVF